MEVAVIGMPDRYHGEVVKAPAVQIEIRNDLPKTAVGKVLRRALREEESSRQPQTTLEK